MLSINGAMERLVRIMSGYGMTAVGTKRTYRVHSEMSASLIGRLGSSAFRLSTTAVSMSLTGSCFSSESAPRPFHHGIRRRGGTILWAALPSVEWQVQADIRTHLIHRPARDIIPPLGGARVFLLSRLILHGPYAAVTSRVHRNSVRSTQMRCMITANRRASELQARGRPASRPRPGLCR